jgi:hypothetical protein
VPVAIVPVITWDWIDIPRAPVAVRHARNRSSLGVSWKAVIRWLMIARQEAVAVPPWRRTFMSRRSRRDDRQQRQDDSNRQKHEARHKQTIDGRLLGGDSNLSAQSSATASGSLAKRPLCARNCRVMSRESFDVHIIWSPQISRRQTWTDHRRQVGRRGRSADHPVRSRRDRSAHHPARRSLGSPPGWDER